ncbi:MAG: PQQ-binding-like beta-propeller repeat protein [Planctomycetaceae bacterium]
MFRFASLAALLAVSTFAHAEDWSRFRGPAGNGVAANASSFPTQWSPNANLAWKTPLPGPGASSPIIVGGKAFVTCYTGYGLDQQNPGKMEDLMRHLICIDMKTGKELWRKDVKAALPEDPYAGAGVPAHGYASHTPVSDGKHVYAFFGKSGVHAFDFDGNKVWEAKVGMESDPPKWGSSSSPIIHENLVIVVASAESQSVIAFDKTSGKEVWRAEAEGLDGMWGTPAMVKVGDDRTDLVMVVAKEMWGLDPATGKMRWMAGATDSENAYSSVIQDGKRVYALTGRGGGSVAIEAGGSGDISETNTVWIGRDNASFASPVLYNNRIYSVSRNIVTVIDAKTGKHACDPVRLKGVAAASGRFGALDYPSPVVVGDRLFYLNSRGQMFVLSTGETPEQIAVNKVTSDTEVFRGTPAISNGQMLLRSSKHLYCVANKNETVSEEDMKMAKSSASPAGGAARGGRGAGGGGRGGRQRFDPMAMFDGMDSNKDGKLVEAELKKSQMIPGDRLMTLDKDGDKAVSKEEFRNISSLFSGRGGRGGSTGGRGRSGGGGGYGRGKDTRPDRPQRPEFADKK